MTSLEIFVDFKSPGSYLALAPALELAERLSLDIEWRPLQTRQESVPEAAAEETRGETHRRVRAEARRRVHKKYAAIRDLPMKFPHHPGNSDLALAALLLLDHPLPFIQGAFNAYWAKGADLNDAAVVDGLLQASGHHLDSTALQAALARVEEGTRAAQERGIPDAPAFVVDEQVFVGREHLDVIEALVLDARKLEAQR